MRLSIGDCLPRFRTFSRANVPVAQGMIDGSSSSSEKLVTQDSVELVSSSDDSSWVALSEDVVSAVAAAAGSCVLGGVWIVKCVVEEVGLALSAARIA